MEQSINRDLHDLLDLMDQSNFSSIKNIVSRVIEVINDPKSTIRDLKQIIEVDPPLSAKILKMANSAYYCRGRVHTSIESSIIWIGFDIVKEIALSQKVCEIFNKKELIEGYSRKKLWKHSVAAATLMKKVFRKEFGESGETAYVCGLLHDIGIIAEDQFVQEAFRKILKKTLTGKHGMVDIEEKVLGFNHAELGYQIAHKWGLPNEISESIRHHHGPFDEFQLNGDDKERMTMTLYLSDYLCHQHQYGYGVNHPLEKKKYDSCLRTLKIKPHSIEMIMEELSEELKKMEKTGIL